MTVDIQTDNGVTTVSINRPEARNAVDPPTARALYAAFLAFEADDSQQVAILTGTDGAFCAGFDLK
ncbi:MAG: enoyl-CoA hydratase-related protein, partial [Paracoccaceae bacterium]